jgi:hypothetical protein
MDITSLFREKELGLFIQHKLGMGVDQEFWTNIRNDRFFDFGKFYCAHKEVAKQWILEYESEYFIEMVKKATF